MLNLFLWIVRESEVDTGLRSCLHLFNMYMEISLVWIALQLQTVSPLVHGGINIFFCSSLVVFLWFSCFSVRFLLSLFFLYFPSSFSFFSHSLFFLFSLCPISLSLSLIPWFFPSLSPSLSPSFYPFPSSSSPYLSLALFLLLRVQKWNKSPKLLFSTKGEKGHPMALPRVHQTLE